MKMTKEDYSKLKTAIENIPKYLIEQAETESEKVGGYNDTAWRWLLFHFVNRSPGFNFRYLHEYLNDNHIDTALRKIVGELK